MPVRYLSDPELAGLSRWPDELADEDVVTCFTLSADDLSWLAGFNLPQHGLGVAAQPSTVIGFWMRADCLAVVRKICSVTERGDHRDR
jgi:hypothetical protein